MLPNTTMEKLARGECTYGYGVRFFWGSDQARFAVNAGFDYLFIDAEHSPHSLAEGTALCRAALEVGITPIVRVCGFDHHLATRYLDNGAQGIIFPHVETVDQIELIAREVYFPPLGQRSLPGPMAINQFLPLPHEKLVEEGNKTTMAVGMIESPSAVNRLDELLAPGVLDAVMIGANDLSTTMGIPAQWENPKFQEAVESVIASCNKAGIASGIGGVFVTELLDKWIGQGMRFMYVLSDAFGLIQYPKARLTEIREAVG